MNYINLIHGKRETRLRTIVMLFLSLFTVFAYAQQQQVHITGTNLTLHSVFKQIEQQTKLSIDYDANLLDGSMPIAKAPIGTTLNAVIYEVLGSTNFIVIYKGAHIILKEKEANLTKQLRGVVVDQVGDPIIGASVMVKGTANGAITDLDGKYSLNNVAEDALILVSYIGYKTQQLSIKADFSKIVMVEDTKMIDEVVVVGYGTQKKVNLTGAVGSVETEKLVKNRPVSNIATALQGAIPGLQITSSNTLPGAKYSFNVRGFTSINGGSPLILVDNNPINDLSMLDPNDIESVSVLKDAASASIYGARAAFGVILVTTKKGASKDEKVKLNYSNNFAFSSAINLPEKANTYEYLTGLKAMGMVNHTNGCNLDTWLEYLEQYNENPSRFPEGYFVDGQGLKYAFRDTDPLGDMMDRFGFQQKHNLSIQGASNKNSYRLSLGFINEDGILHTDKDSYRRANVSAYWKVVAAKWIDFEFDFKYGDALKKAVADDGIRNGLYGSAIISEPYKFLTSDELIDGKQYLRESSRSCLILSEPIKEKEKNLRMMGKFTLKPFKGMTINGEYTYLYNNGETEDYRNRFLTQEQNGNLRENRKVSSYTLSRATSLLQSVNLYGNYAFNVKDHSFVLVGGYNQESQTSEDLNVSKLDVISSEVPSISLSSGVLNANDGFGEYATRSLFYRLNYSYKDRYLFETNGRYDGSSKFPKNSRFGFFPSASAAWRITEEAFMESAKSWLSNAKLRASVGTVGNQFIGNYDYLPGMASYLSSWLVDNGQVTTFKTPSLVSSSFTWEKVLTYNWGADITLFDNFSASFDYYIRNTNDMLVRGSELPSVLGTSAPKANVADLRTKGWEIDVKWQDRIGDWGYNIGFNISDSRAEITKYDNAVGLLSSHRVGENLGEIWGYKTVGLYQADHFDEQGNLKKGIAKVEGYHPNVGDILYEDKNGDGLINTGRGTVEDSGDQQVIGNDSRRYLYAVIGGLTWKNFDFSFMLSGVGKRDLWQSHELIFPYYTAFSCLQKTHLDYWTPENTNAFYPRSYESVGGNTEANRMVQSRYLLNGAYCQIKNISVSYTIPAKVIMKTGLSKCSVFLSGENLYTFYHTPKGLNPEISTAQKGGWTYPEMRKISFGINVTL